MENQEAHISKELIVLKKIKYKNSKKLLNIQTIELALEQPIDLHAVTRSKRKKIVLGQRNKYKPKTIIIKGRHRQPSPHYQIQIEVVK